MSYCDHVLDFVVPVDGVVEGEVVGLAAEGVVPYSSVDVAPNSASVYCEFVGTV